LLEILKFGGLNLRRESADLPFELKSRVYIKADRFNQLTFLFKNKGTQTNTSNTTTNMQALDSKNDSCSPNTKRGRYGAQSKRPQYKAKGQKPQYQARKTTFNTFNEDSTTSSPNNKNSSAVVLSSEGSDRKISF
jgi:hypothetical protein|tara:strand:- start:77 stop:481 length:405 start_codon:yes stop_codon:yes gene_type:complete